MKKKSELRTLEHFQDFCVGASGGASFSLQPRLQPRPSK
jgi:hypothetical protein